MPKPYSGDLRARVIGEIATGASRREAAERYGISASVVVIWAQRFEKTGSVAAKPSGGSTSPLKDKAMEGYASECQRIAGMTADPIIRDEMMKMARRWMEAASGSKQEEQQQQAAE